MVPTVGAADAAGSALITTFDVAEEAHPVVTVKLYVPGFSPVTVVVAPVPATLPGLIVQLPVAGNPLNATVPKLVQVG